MLNQFNSFNKLSLENSQIKIGLINVIQLLINDANIEEFSVRLDKIIQIFEDIPIEDYEFLEKRCLECRKEISELDENSIKIYLKIIQENTKLYFDNVSLEDNKKNLAELIPKYKEAV